MKQAQKLMFNTALLTASSLVMRIIGLAYQVWLAGRIGPAGIGLFQLVMSVSFLCSTFAISGIRFAATRLISEEIGLNRPGGVSKAMQRCIAYSLFFGISAMVLLFAGAEPIGFLWVGDARTVLSLRILSVSLPFISLSSVFSGYFTATGRVYKSAAVQVSEQLVRIALVAAFLELAPAGDLEKSCAAVVAGGSTAEVFSFLVFVAIYFLDRRRHGRPGAYSPRLTTRMFGVALPLAVSAYARSALSTLQNLLVPRGLKSAGLNADAALSGYGIIQGMVFPIIFFPACVVFALAELIVPELTEAQMAGKKEYISRSVSSLLRKCLLFSMVSGGFIFISADALGWLVYKSTEAGHYIRIIALLIPVMYMDIVTDGCLKGLGLMMWNMAYNIIDSLLGVILVVLLLPRWALNGYIGVIFITELVNFALSIYRLRKVADIRLFVLPQRKNKIAPAPARYKR
ncbi:MAG: oligosaccharide flippase family protein [Oscillospiraceae bacterium]